MDYRGRKLRNTLLLGTAFLAGVAVGPATGLIAAHGTDSTVKLEAITVSGGTIAIDAGNTLAIENGVTKMTGVDVNRTLRIANMDTALGEKADLGGAAAPGCGAGHSSGSPAFRTPSNTAGQLGICSIIDLTVNFGFSPRASAKEALASSILPASA